VAIYSANEPSISVTAWGGVGKGNFTLAGAGKQNIPHTLLLS
jgi:hypothetical protein